MSESGLHAFLSASGTADWTVLHGGPTAAFRVDGLAAASRLAAAVADVPGLGPNTVLTATQTHLTVKLTREIWHTESEHIAIAGAISEVARAHGASPDPAAVQEVQVAISAKPDAIDLPFWRAVLGYAPMSDDNAVDPLGESSTVWMQELHPDKPLRHAMHLDVSLSRHHIQARVDAAVAAGGTVVDASEAPAAWILADRSGNKVCLASWTDGAEPSGGDA